jgi:zinc transport system permease protein
MAAFALVFVPPWIAFRFAHGWRRTLAWSAGLGLLAYLVAFAAAIGIDQPFGPVLVVALLAMAPVRAFARA